MKKKQYKRKPGDFEIRFLKDGRLIMIAPDEKLLEIARKAGKEELNSIQRKRNGRRKTT